MISTFEQAAPSIGKDVFIAQSASVMGNVVLGDEANIWYGCVLRGDVGTITIGARTNVQDLSVMHVTGGMYDTTLGADVTVGHRAILHGCSIGEHVLVGMGAVVMDGVEVGPYCIIGAGALLPPGKKIPAGSMVMGAPGRVVRELTEAERQTIAASSLHYVELAGRHMRGCRAL